MNQSQVFTLVVAALAVFSCESTHTDDDGNFRLLILHSNDMHAHYDETSLGGGDCTPSDKKSNKCYGGFARIAYIVKEAKQKADEEEGPPVLHLNAGDNYAGLWHSLFYGEAASDFINAIGFDAMSLGNHEFDDGTSELTEHLKNITKSTPVLCANLVLTGEPELASTKNLQNSIVLIKKGHKIGIIGYLTPNTKTTAKLKNKVEFIDEIVALKEEVKKLQEEGVNIIIALGHSGYAKDIEIAKEVKGLDLVIGGHSHTLLCNNKCPDPNDIVNKNETYPTKVTQTSGKIVPVVQAYCNAKYLGKIDLTFNSNGEIIQAFGQPILLNASIPQNEAVLSLVQEYKRRPQYVEINEDVGRTAVHLIKDSCRNSECNIGNLITDAIVYYYASNYRGEHWTDAPIAILQFGGIRASIEHAKLPSEITMIDLLSVLPFNNKLAVVTMNGTVLLKVLEHAVAKYNTDTHSFLQFSGLKVVYDVSKPVGSRVVKAEARCSACEVPEYSKVNEREVYKVISHGFIAKGGDGFEMLGQSEKTYLDYNELLCTKYFISNMALIYAEVKGRITVLS